MVWKMSTKSGRMVNSEEREAMKRLQILTLVAILSLVIAGCTSDPPMNAVPGSPEDPSPPPAAAVAEEEEEPPTYEAPSLPEPEEEPEEDPEESAERGSAFAPPAPAIPPPIPRKDVREEDRPFDEEEAAPAAVEEPAEEPTAVPDVIEQPEVAADVTSPDAAPDGTPVEEKLPLDKARSKRIFEEALRLIEADKVDKATKILEDWLAMSPHDEINRRNLVHVYISVEQLDLAEPHLRYMVQAKPENAKSWAHLGRIQAQIGKLTQGAGSMAKALELDRNNVDVALDLGKMLAKLRRFDQATKVLETILVQGKRESEILNELGTILVETGENTRAYETYRRLQQVKPTYGTALTMATLGAKFSKCDQVSDALAGWDKDFTDEKPFLLLARCALKDKALLQAQKHLLAGLDKNKACYVCALQLGDVYFENGQWEPAVQYYAKAVEIDPKEWQPFNQLGKALANSGKHIEATRAFKAANERKPQDPDILFAWGVESLLAGNKADAWKIWGILDELDAAKGKDLKNMLLR